jgi:hypothetical protein
MKIALCALLAPNREPVSKLINGPKIRMQVRMTYVRFSGRCRGREYGHP